MFLLAWFGRNKHSRKLSLCLKIKVIQWFHAYKRHLKQWKQWSPAW